MSKREYYVLIKGTQFLVGTFEQPNGKVLPRFGSNRSKAMKFFTEENAKTYSKVYKAEYVKACDVKEYIDSKKNEALNKN